MIETDNVDFMGESLSLFEMNISTNIISIFEVYAAYFHPLAIQPLFGEFLEYNQSEREDFGLSICREINRFEVGKVDCSWRSWWGLCRLK